MEFQTKHIQLAMSCPNGLQNGPYVKEHLYILETRYKVYVVKAEFIDLHSEYINIDNSNVLSCHANHHINKFVPAGNNSKCYIRRSCIVTLTPCPKGVQTSTAILTKDCCTIFDTGKLDLIISGLHSFHDTTNEFVELPGHAIINTRNKHNEVFIPIA